MLEKDYERERVAQFAYENQQLSYYMIETEETQDGFPDVLVVDKNIGKSSFLEFKVSDSRGRIKFRKSQPLFYKKNYFLKIDVVALDIRNNKEHRFPALALFDKDNMYKLDLNTRMVQL